MRTAMAGLVIIIMCAAGLAQQIPPVVGSSGSLKDLAGTPNLVTIVLKGSGALDQNLKVTGVGPDYVSVVDEDGENTAYLFESVQEVRVQKEAVERPEMKVADNQMLRIEEQRVLDRALARVREIFDGANADQNLKMRAATLMAANGNKEGFAYLEKLAATNHIETELDAYQCLYLAGYNEPPSLLISEGLQSGNRLIKAKAATIAGLYNDQSTITVLAPLLQDRLAEISAPAAMALARMGWREAIPTLMRMIGELHEAKGDAAVFGLARLGGPDVLSKTKAKLETATGLTRYRLILLLYKLEDPDALRLLLDEGLSDSGKALKTACALAKRGDWTGRQYLVSYLKNKYFDETEVNLVNRAQAAVALVAAGDLTAISEIQTLLSINNAAARKRICLMIAKLGKRKLIPVMQPTIENADREVAMEACTAVLAIAKPKFQARLVELMN
ncbi:MAG TPA: HEAT repeat domain-containing protein [Candidatus Bathyarchaeia archaeon]|nr:HEAT repeat domain-containing protein [Candidatus Bathyarchaeia archaeon]